MGVDPTDMTLRELMWMSDGRGKAEWAQTAQVLCLIANVNRPPHRKAYKVEEFYPYAERKHVPLEMLRGLCREDGKR